MPHHRFVNVTFGLLRVVVLCRSEVRVSERSGKFKSGSELHPLDDDSLKSEYTIYSSFTPTFCVCLRFPPVLIVNQFDISLAALTHNQSLCEGVSTQQSVCLQ